MVSVCAKPGCPNLTPCPKHSRPANGHWTKTRNRKTQQAFRNQLIQRDGLRCKRCGHTGIPLQAHHDTDTTGRLLCTPCHKAVDPSAR